MRQVLWRAVALANMPSVLACGLFTTLGGCALMSVPLFEIPGYELGTAMALASILTGGVAGIAAALQERQLISGKEPRPKRAQRSDGPFETVLQATSAATVFSTVLLVPPFVACAVHARLKTPCNALAFAGFYPLLTLPSATLASSAGAFCGFICRRRWTAGLLYGSLLIASAVATVWPLCAGPQVYAWNHFGGYLPGPLYDEALALPPALFWFRLETVLWAALLIALGATGLDMLQGRVTWPRFRWGPICLVAILALSLGAMERNAAPLGFRMTRKYLLSQLDGQRETTHFVLHYPSGMGSESIERFSRDAEFRYRQISRFFEGAPARKIQIFLYRSAEQKQHLVGASLTQFAKPWLLELHLNASAFPNPSLKHELAHVMAEPFGAGPFAATARWGLWPVMGIIEGMAVAADNPHTELTLHEAAAAMRRQHLAPDIRQVLGPEGFYNSPQSRAYTLVGSFLRYLADKYGSRPLTLLYRHGRFEDVYGKPLSTLATEWEGFLDALPLEEKTVNQAFVQFHDPGLFARQCAREVATDQLKASRLMETEPATAGRLYQRCGALQPGEPSFQLGEAEALLRLQKKREAATLLKSFARRNANPAVRAQMALAQADVAYAQQNTGQAKAFLEEVLRLDSTPALERTAEVKLAGLTSSAAGKAIWGYFRPGHQDVNLLQLKLALEREPGNGFVSYLLGRGLLLTAPKLAFGFLQHAQAQAIPKSVLRETERLLPEAAYLAGQCNEVRNIVERLHPPTAAFAAQVHEWRERCEFEESTFEHPPTPSPDFR